MNQMNQIIDLKRQDQPYHLYLKSQKFLKMLMHQMNLMYQLNHYYHQNLMYQLLLMYLMYLNNQINHQS
jgi:hypothetical protein